MSTSIRVDRTSPHRLSVEASTIGWAPGEWPRAVTLTIDGTERTCEFVAMKWRGGDLLSHVYMDASGFEVEVLND